jgi:tetratricopeptide (TPR) repeat protein
MSQVHMIGGSCFGFVALMTGIVAGATGSLQEPVAHSADERVLNYLRQGQFLQAEQDARRMVEERPADARALTLLGTALDGQMRFTEAEGCYLQARRVAPRMPLVLNSLGNHYLAKDQPEQARAFFLEVLALNVADPNANMQLARLDLARKDGISALKRIERLPLPLQNTPDAGLVRAQALFLAGRNHAAERLLDQLERQFPKNAQIHFSTGLLLIEQQKYDGGEQAFARALEAAPGNFDILYNLGIAAFQAEHLARAGEVFEIARTQRPNDVDCLFNLARVYDELGRKDESLLLLHRAHHLAPSRPEILLLIADITEKGGLYSDTVAIYDEYLKVNPKDDAARRKRAFTLATMGKVEEALPDLRAFVNEHPKDARGIYELGVVEAVKSPDKAFRLLDRAIALAPAWMPAWYARASLKYQEGQAANALPDVQQILREYPNHFRALDLLGQCYLQLDRTQEAADSLGHAAEVAPQDPKILLHYAQALRRLGRTEETGRMLARFKALGPYEPVAASRPDLMQLLNLPLRKRTAELILGLRKTLSLAPTDTRLRLQLGKLLLADGQTEEAIHVFRQVRDLSPDPGILAQCGRALLDSEQYSAARIFLSEAVQREPSLVEARIDMALATYQAVSPEDAITELDAVAPQERFANYYLVRAQVLDALHRSQEAAASIEHAIGVAAGLSAYAEAALFLIAHDRRQDALRAAQEGLRKFPNSRELLLAEALVCALLEQHNVAVRLLLRIEERWPEWYAPYLAHGILLERLGKSAEAKPLLETAVTLGTQMPVAQYYLAWAILHSTPADIGGAWKAIEKATASNPSDPYSRCLAGRIAYLRKDYSQALQQLNEALRLAPGMGDAGRLLRDTQRALGLVEPSVIPSSEERTPQGTHASAELPPLPAASLLSTALRGQRRST